VDNLGSQKELEVIHSRLFEILGYIFQKHRSGVESTRHIRAGLSRGFITQRCRPVAQQPPASPGNAVNQA
jgi:hypothetical protein